MTTMTMARMTSGMARTPTMSTRAAVLSQACGMTVRAASTPTGTARMAPSRVDARAIWMVTSIPAATSGRMSPVAGGRKKDSVVGSWPSPLRTRPRSMPAPYHDAVSSTAAAIKPPARASRCGVHGGVNARGGLGSAGPGAAPGARAGEAPPAPRVGAVPVRRVGARSGRCSQPSAVPPCNARRSSPETTSTTKHTPSTISARAIPRWYCRARSAFAMARPMPPTPT